eukprot:NODE_869_length_3566_cov_0.357658.p2 type:complete len:174 gc:universal NODE_869_length_3566_cov_0.357658:2423-2944(+)
MRITIPSNYFYMNFHTDFIDALNSLPNEVQHKLTTLKEKDSIGNSYFDELERRTRTLMESHGSEALSGKETTDLYNLFKKTLMVYEEKVALSVQMHDLVDNNIKRIDEDLQRMSANDYPIPPVPVDNEQIYCYCQQPAFGEMVGCDADHCPIEWFHLPCCNLTKIPSGNLHII